MITNQKQKKHISPKKGEQLWNSFLDGGSTSELALTSFIL